MLIALHTFLNDLRGIPLGLRISRVSCQYPLIEVRPFGGYRTSRRSLDACGVLGRLFGPSFRMTCAERRFEGQPIAHHDCELVEPQKCCNSRRKNRRIETRMRWFPGAKSNWWLQGRNDTNDRSSTNAGRSKMA